MSASDDRPPENHRSRHSSRRGRAGFEKLTGGRSWEDRSGGYGDVPVVRPDADTTAAAPSRPEATGQTLFGPGAATPIEQFRATSRRIQIHPLESALLWIVGAHMVFLPWALGTMRLWGQVGSLLLAVASLVVALLPRHYRVEHTGAAEFRLIPWPKLTRFPIFWLGGALLALVVVQALNPAWDFRTNGRSWWMQAVDHVGWLPSGVRVPFERWGPWRNLMIYTSGWMTVCAIWIGFTRRRTLQRFFLVLACNGLVLALFGLAQRIVGTTKIFGFVESPNVQFFASFIYKNHAGAYFNLALAVASGVGSWYYLRGVRRLEKSNPSGVFAFIVTCIAVSVLVSYARGATLIMLGYLCVIVAAFIFHQTRLPKDVRSPLIAIGLLLVFGFFLKTGLQALNSELAWDRLRAAMAGNDVSVHAREVANQASLAMLGDHWGWGTGSGSYQFLFTPYQMRFPEIWTLDGVRLLWEHAHNDVLQFPIELGVPGVLIIAACFAYWTFTLLRAYAWQNPLSASVILGCVFMIGMAWGDFVFQCPAVLITWCALWPASTLWARLEEQRSR